MSVQVFSIDHRKAGRQIALGAGARHKNGYRRDSSTKQLESERMSYARQETPLWGSQGSCGRLVIGPTRRVPRAFARESGGRQPPRRLPAGCQPAPHHASNATFESRTPWRAAALLTQRRGNFDAPGHYPIRDLQENSKELDRKSVV